MKHLKLYENFTPQTNLAVDTINDHENGDEIFNIMEEVFGKLTILYEQGMNIDFIYYINKNGDDVMSYHKKKKILFIFSDFYDKLIKFTFDTNTTDVIYKWYIGTNYQLDIDDVHNTTDQLHLWNILNKYP